MTNAWLGAWSSRRQTGLGYDGELRRLEIRAEEVLSVLAACHFTVRSRNMPCHLCPMTGQYTL